MVELPMVRCPGCGKHLGPVKSRIIPLAEKFEDCLRRCERCRIGASNAKNPAKVRFIKAGGAQPAQEAAPGLQEAPAQAQAAPEKPQEQQAAPAQQPAPEKPQEPAQEAPKPEAQKQEPELQEPPKQEPPQP